MSESRVEGQRRRLEEFQKRWTEIDRRFEAVKDGMEDRGRVHDANSSLGAASMHMQTAKRALASKNPDADSIERYLIYANRLMGRAHESIEGPGPKGKRVRTARELAEELAYYPIMYEAAVSNNADGHHVMADSGLLDRMMHNLASNANRATEESGRIDVRFRSKGPHMVIEVADTGRGMPEEHMERFNRGEDVPTTKDEGGEHGLGLQVVRQAVREHNGEVKVGRNKGGGTLFRIKIPLKRPGPEPRTRRPKR